MNEIALGKATPATMRDMSHARQPFDAACVIAVSEGEQRLAKRPQQRILWIRRRRIARINVRQYTEDALRRRSTLRSGERHHRVCDIEGPRAGQRLRLPPISQ